MPQSNGRLYPWPDRWALASCYEALARQVDGFGFMTLTQFSRGFRLRAASVLVVLYALCVLTPAAALALGDAAKAAHCLTDENHGLGPSHANSKPHVHDDGNASQHSHDGDEQQSTSGQCCGLFCLSALAPSTDLPLAQPELPALVPSLNANGLLGHGPDRLDRPPDSLLSL